MVRVEAVVSMPFAENAYLVGLEGRPDLVVFDPGTEPELIVEAVGRWGRSVAAIINTHGHADHIAGNGTLKQAFPDAPLVVGRNDAAMLTDARLNLSASFGMPFVSPPADRLLDHGETYEVAGLTMAVREIPGHSPGSVVFIVQGEDPPLVIGGDVLFRGSIGRTDFPGGSLQTLLAGIREHLWPLPDATEVYPGHGEPTTVGEEKRDNPFLQG
jgi:glyoxylase-like metal-dependent hydrolase (beta-lactamase superfamily II)